MGSSSPDRNTRCSLGEAKSCSPLQPQVSYYILSKLGGSHVSHLESHGAWSFVAFEIAPKDVSRCVGPVTGIVWRLQVPEEEVQLEEELVHCIMIILNKPEGLITLEASSELLPLLAVS